MAGKPKLLKMDVIPKKHLPGFIEEIHTFLISNEKSYTFPPLKNVMEDILVNIAKDPNFLRKFDDECVSRQILEILEKNKLNYTLSCCIEKSDGKQVVVYKKEPVTMPIFKEPLGLKLLRKPHLLRSQPTSINRINTKTVMSSFKTTCLNATLKFVKNETQLVLQYPDASTEQADFIKHMISQCLSSTSSDSTPTGRSMFDPLAEALRIYSREYSFELKDKSKTDMKQLFLEKIPKEQDIQQDMLEKEITSKVVQKSLPKKSKNLCGLQASPSSVRREFTQNVMNKLKEFLESTEESLIFTELSRVEQDQILNWVSVINRSEIVSTVLDKIRSYVEYSKSRFTLVLASKTVSPINRTVTLKKKRKKQPNNNVGVKKVAQQMCPDLFDQLVPQSNSIDKQEIKVKQFIKKTNSLSDGWMINALSQLNNFIMDDAKASSIFPFVNDEQVEFLSKWQTMLARQEVIEKYSTIVQIQLKDLKKNMDTKISWLRVNSACSKRRKDLTRHLTLTKIPYYGDSTTQQMPTKTEPKVNTVKEVAKSKPKSEITSKNVEPDKCTELGIPKSSSVTSLPVSKVSVGSDRGRPRSATGNPKAKLIEALNQPLVSERGLKMMKIMGWDGGALGLRGEGIVEPIALPLDLKRGAGLGCEIKETKQSKQPANFTIDTNIKGDINRVVLNHRPGKLNILKGFLHTMLNMMDESTQASEVVFPKELKRKQWTFLKNAVMLMNERKKLTYDLPILNEISQKISDKLSNNSTIFTVCLGVSKKNVLFVQSNTKYQPVDLTKWCSVININSSQVTECSMPLNIDESIVVAGETFRCYVLAQILEFCQEKNSNDKVTDKVITKEIQLKGVMLPKHMSFIRDLITRLNRKSRVSSECKKEQAVFADILTVMTDFILHVDFPVSENIDDIHTPVNKIIRFHKIFEGLLKSKTTTITAENNTHTEKGDVSNEKMQQEINIKTDKKSTKNYKMNIKSDEKRRTTYFTTDTFDEKCMFESQSAIDDQNEPKLDKLLSRQGQNKPKDDNATKHDRNTPKMDKNAFKNTPVIDKNVPIEQTNTTIVEDFICCLPDEKDIDEENSKETTIQYIFLKEEIIEYDNKPIVTKIEDRQRRNTEESDKTLGTIESLDENIQNLSINDKNETKLSEHLVKLTEEITGLCLETKQISKKDSKRPISNPVTPDRARKVRKCEKFFEKIKITPKNYPQTEITDETAEKIQKSILKSIDYTEELPLLQCHGIQDGGLVYSCHTEQSLNFLLQILKSDYQITMTEESEHFCYKMSVKINSFVKENVEDIFDRLETYNMSLNTKNWKLLDITRGSDFVTISIDIDENSYKVIYRENFTLHTGIDLAKFSILWECDN